MSVCYSDFSSLVDPSQLLQESKAIYTQYVEAITESERLDASNSEYRFICAFFFLECASSCCSSSLRTSRNRPRRARTALSARKSRVWFPFIRSTHSQKELNDSLEDELKQYGFVVVLLNAQQRRRAEVAGRFAGFALRHARRERPSAAANRDAGCIARGLLTRRPKRSTSTTR